MGEKKKSGLETWGLKSVLVELDLLIFLYMCGVYSCISRGAPLCPWNLVFVAWATVRLEKKKKEGGEEDFEVGLVWPPLTVGRRKK